MSAVHREVWNSLGTSRTRADNIEEGHFAERTWAALLSKPLGLEQANKIMSHAHHTNHFVATDGGGHLGALVAFTGNECGGLFNPDCTSTVSPATGNLGKPEGKKGGSNDKDKWQASSSDEDECGGLFNPDCTPTVSPAPASLVVIS